MNRPLPEVIKHLIIVNVLFFVAKMAIPQFNLNELFNLHYIANPNFRYWQLVTGIFMHDSFTHLLFNMVGLYFIGSPMAEIFGKQKFVFFYFSAGIGASLIYLTIRHFEFSSAMNALGNMGATTQEIYDLFSPTKRYADANLQAANEVFNMQLLGASGAIFGLLAAFAWYFPNTKIYVYFVIPITTKYFVTFIIIADLISGITGQPIISPSNTAYFAHVGGAIIGLIMAILWKKNQHRTF